MSETIRVYTPPAAGSFDPYTAAITGRIPAFFGLRELPPPPVLTPASAPEVIVDNGGGGDSSGLGGLGTGNVNMGGQMAGSIDLGPSPGTLDRSFGQEAYGRMGSMLGTLAGMATGVPGLGLGLGALGTLADVRGLNADLAMMGLPQEVAPGPAFLSNMTAGYFGTPAATQFGNILGFDALAEGPLSAFASRGIAAAPAAAAPTPESIAADKANMFDSVPAAWSADKTAPGIGGEKDGFQSGGGFTGMSMDEAVANAVAANIDADYGPGGVFGGDGGGPSGDPGGGTDSAADSPGAGGGVGADGSVGSGGDAWKKGGLVKFAEGGLAELLDEDVSPRTAREYFRELIRADAQRNLQGLPEILANTGFDRNRGVNLVPYGARVRAQMPGMREDDMLDLSAGYQGATVSGRGFRQSRNLLQEAGAGYTFPDGGRLSLDYFDRMDGGEVESGIERDPDLRHQDVRAPSDAEMMGRPVPSRGVRLGYRREFASGGLVPLAGGGKIAIGPGGGLDDLIPTSINGRRAAALSDGEFVIPADVVSMMGDGSSNAGARRLYDLVRQVRNEKTGTTKQAGPLPVGEILKRSMSR